MAHTIKSMPTNQIKPIIVTKNGVSGGLDDIGNFKEGYCWRVIQSDDVNWVMCSDALDDKEGWMAAIREIKNAYTVFEAPPKKIEGTITLGHEMDIMDKPQDFK